MNHRTKWILATQLDIVPNTNHFNGLGNDGPSLVLTTLNTFYTTDKIMDRGY